VFCARVHVAAWCPCRSARTCPSVVLASAACAYRMSIRRGFFVASHKCAPSLPAIQMRANPLGGLIICVCTAAAACCCFLSRCDCSASMASSVWSHTHTRPYIVHVVYVCVCPPGHPLARANQLFGPPSQSARYTTGPINTCISPFVPVLFFAY
jgi:hypothetical protein